jgi:hypothetical protein
MEVRILQQKFTEVTSPSQYLMSGGTYHFDVFTDGVNQDLLVSLASARFLKCKVYSFPQFILRVSKFNQYTRRENLNTTSLNLLFIKNIILIGKIHAYGKVFKYYRR